MTYVEIQRLEPIKKFFLKVCIVIVVSLIVLSLLIKPVNKIINEREVVVSVLEKGKFNNGYIIYGTTNTGESVVYQISNSLLRNTFGMDEIYGNIRVDSTYRFAVCGYRNKMLGIYPNIWKGELIR